jgi:predicted MFS family arabinose efflux permease
MAVLLISGSAEVWMLAVLAGITGAGTGFFNPASTGLLPSIVAPERLQQANGLRATAQATGEIAGPAVAGVLVATAGAGWAIAIDAATFAISAVLLAALRVDPRDARVSTRFLRDLKDGWTAFTARTWVWAFVAGAALGNLCWGAWSALGPVVADRDLGGATAWGTVLSAMGAGGLLGGVLAVRAAPRRPLLLASALGPVFALPLAILASGAPLVVLAVTTFGAGAALMYSNTVWESTLQRHVPAESLSRVSAYDWFGSLAFYPLGLAIWGPVSEAIGVSRSLWLSFGLQVVIAGALLSVADIRRLTSGASSSGA